MSNPLLLCIDQGTTSTRAMLFERDGSVFAVSQQEFPQHYPKPGWVEHDVEDIWNGVLQTTREVVSRALAERRTIAALGITNQRETTVLWDRATGKAIHPAIVWQDRRTAETCRQLKAAGHETRFTQSTGLLLDPYFSGTKLAWLLENVDGAHDRAARGELAFGTIDSFLIWRLSGGQSHVTDATNASRTLLYNIHDNRWDKDLLTVLNIPASVLPEVRDSASDFGRCDKALFGLELTIGGVAGDQQAATVGQACFQPGMVKSTYGTGCFMMLNTGTQALASSNKLLTTIAYRLNGETTYALEGSIFIAGAAVQWLRDELNLIDDASETEALARSLDDNQGVYLVPAFTGLGAPHWDPDARGALFGLTRGSGKAAISRAALESVCYQTADLFSAMQADGANIDAVRVDGGMINNNWLAQFLSDILDVTVQRPRHTETTALGSAWLAGLHAGVYDSLDDMASQWQAEQAFKPAMQADERTRLMSGWQDAVRRTLGAAVID